MTQADVFSWPLAGSCHGKQKRHHQIQKEAPEGDEAVGGFWQSRIRITSLVLDKRWGFCEWHKHSFIKPLLCYRSAPRLQLWHEELQSLLWIEGNTVWIHGAAARGRRTPVVRNPLVLGTSTYWSVLDHSILYWLVLVHTVLGAAAESPVWEIRVQLRASDGQWQQEKLYSAQEREACKEAQRQHLQKVGEDWELLESGTRLLTRECSSEE